MKALSQTIAISALLGLTTGCLLVEDTGTVESSVGTPVTTPPDFTVTDGNGTPPPTGGDNGTLPTVPEPEVMEEGFLINGGATRTNAGDLQLQLITLNRFAMKISMDRDCSSGVWEAWTEFKTVPTPQANAVNTISVQYKDWDNRITRCYRQAIVHDGQGPDILFTRYPASSLEEGSTADLTAEVSDAGGTVASVTCSLNGLAKSCVAGRNEVSITQLPAGSYEFRVRASDDLGNVSEKSVSWNVVSLTRRLSQSLRVNDYKKVDILMVIDNSGSMEYEQRNMAQRTSNLLSVIRGLDYQIAITTTDPENSTYGDGRFVNIKGTSNQFLIDTSVAESTAQTRLSQTLQRSETGSGVEQGIRAAYRAVERYNANESKARAFFREGAQFAVVLISDEDESANTPKNDPQNLVKLVHDSFGGQKMFGFHSIITQPGDTVCRSTYGYSYGDRYDAMSRLTGGVIGSVCAADYSTQVTGIAQGIRDLLKSMTLQCAPLPEKGITVKRGGVAVTSPYTIEGVNLKFANELEPGDYTVDYSCLR